MSATLLQARNIHCTLGTNHVLRGANFDASPGEFLAVLGSNGAGTSTLLDTLAGIRKPNNGDVLVDGQLLAQIPVSRRSRILCHLPQGVSTNLPFRVQQVVLMGRSALADDWFESAEDHRVAEAAMERTDCLDLRHRAFSSLSGGERQRVLLAACLAQQAKILLMDEPSTYLDLHQQLHCFRLLREEAARGSLCVTVTHDLNLALSHCSRILVLRDGVIAADMQTTEAWNNRDWLHWFSPRLCVETSNEGNAWVAYR